MTNSPPTASDSYRTPTQDPLRPIPDDLYRDVLRTMPVPCVDLLIQHSGRILMVQRRNEPARGEWWFPGGRIHKGERLLQTAHRQAREEVGARGLCGALVHVEETLFETGRFGEPVHTVNLCYAFDALSKEVTLDADHTEYMWCLPAQLLGDRNLHPYLHRCLVNAGFRAAAA